MEKQNLITLTGKVSYTCLGNTPRKKVKDYVLNNKELQALMAKYHIEWTFKHNGQSDFGDYSFDNTLEFRDYEHYKSNDYSNIDAFISEMKEVCPLFLIKDAPEFDKKNFNKKYDRVLSYVDKQGKWYHYIYFNDYSYKMDNMVFEVALDEKLAQIIKNYYNSYISKCHKGHKYNVILAHGKQNYEGKDAPTYDALIVIGGGLNNTNLIDQVNVIKHCHYNKLYKTLYFGDIDFPLDMMDKDLREFLSAL